MSDSNADLSLLSEKLKAASLPKDLFDRVNSRLTQLTKLVDSSTFLPELDRINNYIDWITNLPWNKKTQVILDLEYAKKVLDKNHFGLTEVKERIAEYISVLKLKAQLVKILLGPQFFVLWGLSELGKQPLLTRLPRHWAVKLPVFLLEEWEIR